MKTIFKGEKACCLKRLLGKYGMHIACDKPYRFRRLDRSVHVLTLFILEKKKTLLSSRVVCVCVLFFSVFLSVPSVCLLDLTAHQTENANEISNFDQIIVFLRDYFFDPKQQNKN